MYRFLAMRIYEGFLTLKEVRAKKGDEYAAKVKAAYVVKYGVEPEE